MLLQSSATLPWILAVFSDCPPMETPEGWSFTTANHRNNVMGGDHGLQQSIPEAHTP